MAYIGKQPVIGNFQKCDAIAVVNGQAAYTLQVGGTNVSPQSENHMLVSLNGILQAPTDSFTVSGSTITFASALSTGDVIDFVMILGNVLDLGVPSDNTVSLAKLTATGTKDATTFLRGDNTFVSVTSGITMADQWRLSSASTLSNGQFVTANWEQVDTGGYGTIGSAMTESSGVFTFPSTGIYLIIGKMVSYMDAARLYVGHGIYTTTNNSSYAQVADAYNGIYAGYAWSSSTTHFIFDVTSTSTHKIKMGIWTASSANTIVNGGTNSTETGITFVRLGDT